MENKYTRITKREGHTSHEMAVELSFTYRLGCMLTLVVVTT